MKLSEQHITEYFIPTAFSWTTKLRIDTAPQENKYRCIEQCLQSIRFEKNLSLKVVLAIP